MPQKKPKYDPATCNHTADKWTYSEVAPGESLEQEWVTCNWMCRCGTRGKKKLRGKGKDR